MLHYLFSGKKHFGSRLRTESSRKNWEFLAVIEGSVAAITPGCMEPEYYSRSMWVFPPEASHSWRAQGGQAEIAAFHYSTAPSILADFVRANGHIRVELSPAEISKLVKAATELRQLHRKISPLGPLVFQRQLIDLSLLAFKAAPQRSLGFGVIIPEQKVDAAIQWFCDHLGEHPKFDQVARAVRVSTSQLRRLFLQVTKKNPQTIFTRLRLERAMSYMVESDHKLATIASQCGFANGASFGRAFKKQFKCTPDAWRKKAADGKVMPEHHHTRHYFNENSRHTMALSILKKSRRRRKP